MRLFTAIDLPEEVVDRIAALIDRLRPTARIKWSPADNLHITTKFIGEWPDAKLAQLEEALRGLPRHRPIPIEIRGLGFFPNPRSPRVFWAGIEAPEDLGRLARETDSALARQGVEPENRPFSPHLTLARIKEPGPLDSLRQAVAGLASTEFGSFTVDRFYLYQSQLRPSGSVYTRLSEFSFE